MNRPERTSNSEELNEVDAQPSACCSNTELATCCEPSAKAGCCGTQADASDQAPSSCGCR